MDRYDIIEFSKVYKRVLDVEITLKQKMLFALTTAYPKNEFSRLIPYLKIQVSHKKYIQNGRDRIEDLINSNKPQQERLISFLNIAYLIDVLNILSNYQKVVKDKNFRSIFYQVPPDLNILKKQASSLNLLRNSIMHFDFKTYSQNKLKWLEALTYWEKLLTSPNMKCIHDISPIKRPTVAPILRALSEVYPDFLMLSDRLVCDMFDDAAFVNGWDVKDLPEYWTIGRQLYNLKRDNKILTD